jgi:hypothetical protein
MCTTTTDTFMTSTLTLVLGLFLPLVSSLVVSPSLAHRPQSPATTTRTAIRILCNKSSLSQPTDTMSSIPKWFQHEISITAPSRGCHLITSQIITTISKDVSQITIGLAHIFCLHTSASLTINENADPDVRLDLEAALNKIVPASWNHDGTFRHTMEGDDDMPVS